MNELNRGSYVFVKFNEGDRERFGFIKFQNKKDETGRLVGKLKSFKDTTLEEYKDKPGLYYLTTGKEITDIVNSDIFTDGVGFSFEMHHANDYATHENGDFYKFFEIIEPEKMASVFEAHRIVFKYLQRSTKKTVMPAYAYLLKELRNWAKDPENMAQLEKSPEFLAYVLGL